MLQLMDKKKTSVEKYGSAAKDIRSKYKQDKEGRQDEQRRKTEDPKV